MNNQWGEGVSQREILSSLELKLGMTAIATAKTMGSNYDTYKEWKGGRRNMTGPTLLLIKMLIQLSGTKLGKQFGI